ncbi:MAG: NUDIX domain-containing protein, partial [bacterium]
MAIIEHALTVSNKIIIVIGSAFNPRTYKNPFFENERAHIIIESLEAQGYQDYKDFRVIYSVDYLYDNDKWASEIKENVKLLTQPNDKIALIGHRKDVSSFYLDLFPEYELIELPSLENLSSQDIRELYFKESPNLNFFNGVIPKTVQEFLVTFSKKQDFQMIIRGREYEEKYKKPYLNLPYPPTFITADAMVFSGDNILLIERGNEPGKGLLALPGGFLDAKDESLESAMFRELKEETGLELLPDDIIDSCVFDAIGRSPRGRIITHVFVLDIPEPLEVIPASDAVKAQWYDIKTLNRRM